jgi:hypothetical protein
VAVIFWWESQKRRYNMRRPKCSGRIISRFILEKYDGGGMDWIHPAFVNTVMKLPVP